jgi:hypothetical protein
MSRQQLIERQRLGGCGDASAIQPRFPFRENESV